MISETRSSSRYSPTGSRKRLKVTLKIASRSIVRRRFLGNNSSRSSTDGRLRLRLNAGFGHSDGPAFFGFLRLFVLATYRHFAPHAAFIRRRGRFGGGVLSNDRRRLVQHFGHFAGAVLSYDQRTRFRRIGQFDGSLLSRDYWRR